MPQSPVSRTATCSNSSSFAGSAFVRRFTMRATETPAPYMLDAEVMKEKMRQEMCKPKYDVTMYYHKSGFTQWMARHPRFEQSTLIIIGLNALWIWIDTDHNPASMLLNSPPLFQIVEYFFCMYFTLEWSMRFGAFKRKCNAWRDAWFVFDSLLVASMVLETWIMTAILLFVTERENGGMGIGTAGLLRLARLMRLTRMTRMARLLRAMPELLILVKGMLAAMRSVYFTLGLLFVMLYIFGIVFVQLCDDSPCEVIFPDVPSAMHELLLNAALMDGLNNLVKPLKKQSLLLLIILYAFIFLSALTVMNMLIGVICQVVSTVADTENEALQLTFVHEKIRKLMCESGVDQDNDQTISKEEFTKLLVNPKAIAILQDVGVDVVGLVDFKDMLFENEASTSTNGDDEDDDDVVSHAKEIQLTFSDLMGLVLDMRGGNTATVRDMVNLRKYINTRFSAIEKKLARPKTTMPYDSLWLGGSKTPMPRVSCNGNGTQEDQDRALASASVNPRSSARLGLPPRLKDIFSSLQDMMSAHETQVAALESENRQLKEQVAQLARDAGGISQSTARIFCTELDVSSNREIVIPAPVVQPPKEAEAELRTEPSLTSSAACSPRYFAGLVPQSPKEACTSCTLACNTTPGLSVARIARVRM